jgi:hypothetical protein
MQMINILQYGSDLVTIIVKLYYIFANCGLCDEFIFLLILVFALRKIAAAFIFVILLSIADLICKTFASQQLLSLIWEVLRFILATMIN